MRISNIDTLSALIDRLITERIKQLLFKKDGKDVKADEQEQICIEIKKQISSLFSEIYYTGKYEYLSENRTFNQEDIAENIDELTKSDFYIGESDRARLKEALAESPKLATLIQNEKLLRRANENRSSLKNEIDNIVKKSING